MGYTRSQSATEKQVPAKGIKPRRIDPNDGRFTSSLHQNWLTDCSRVRCLDDGAATTNPATEIGHPKLGQIAVGSVADIAVLRLDHGTFGYADLAGGKVTGTERIA